MASTEVIELGSPSGALRPQPEAYRQLTDGFDAIDVSPWAQQRVCVYSGSSSLYARHSFRAGDLLSSFGAKATLSTPNYLTVQVGEQRHIMLQPEWLQYINHSCDPNVAFDTTTLQLVALKDIQAGDELVFFYNSTEWELSAPFACRCNTGACCGTVRGAKHMTPAQLSRYRLTDFIKGKLSTTQSA